jgi:thiol:disulfide interchange protein DsbC
MKKIFIGSLLSSSLLFGALSDAEILQVFEGGDEELKYTIDSRKNLPNTNFEEIKIKMSDGENSAYIALYSDGAYIFPDVIDIKNKISYLANFENAQAKIAIENATKKLGELIKSMPKDSIISIGNDKNKETKYLFTDPDCPYCRQDLELIEAKLKNTNLKIILAPVSNHGIPAIKKSIAILNEAKSLGITKEELIQQIEKEEK